MTWRIFCLFGQNSTVITPDYFCSCTKYPKKPWWKLTPFINGGQFKILLYWFKLALLTSFQSKNSFNFKMRLERLILILAKEFIIGRHLWKWSILTELLKEDQIVISFRWFFHARTTIWKSHPDLFNLISHSCAYATHITPFNASVHLHSFPLCQTDRSETSGTNQVKTERHFPIKPRQLRGMGLIIFYSFRAQSPAA